MNMDIDYLYFISDDFLKVFFFKMTECSFVTSQKIDS